MDDSDLHYQLRVYDLELLQQYSPNLFHWATTLGLPQAEVFKLLAHCVDVMPTNLTPSSDVFASIKDSLTEAFQYTYEDNGLYSTRYDEANNIFKVEVTHTEDEIIDLALMMRNDLGNEAVYVHYLTHHVPSSALYLGVEYNVYLPVH